MLMIKKRVKEDSFGQMAESMKVDGEMENSMELEHILQLAVRPSKENGKKVRDSIGSHLMTNDDFRLTSNLY